MGAGILGDVVGAKMGGSTSKTIPSVLPSLYIRASGLVSPGVPWRRIIGRGLRPILVD